MLENINNQSIVLKKDYLDSNVVNVFILPLPRLHRSPLQHLHCLFCIVPNEGRHHHLKHFLVGNELPQSVRSHHHELLVYILSNVPLVTSQQVTYGSLMTPTVEATQSPKDRVIARPGMFFSWIQMRQGPICSPSSSRQGNILPPFILMRYASLSSQALWSKDKGLYCHFQPTRLNITARESPKFAQNKFCSCKYSKQVVAPEKFMSIPDYYKFFDVFINASFRAFSIIVLENFLSALFLRKKYSIFSGRISLMKSETKCPLTPCPSQTPNKQRSFIMKFSMMMQESWLILSFLSTASPFLLQKAYLAMRLRDSMFLLLACSASSWPHQRGDILRLSCDLVLACLGFFGSFLSLVIFSLISFWCLPSALMVFLWSFFFLESGLASVGFPKKFKFLIYMLMLILGVFWKLARAEGLADIFQYTSSLGWSFDSFLAVLGFLGVQNLRYLVSWKNFSLKLLFLSAPVRFFLLFVRLVYFIFLNSIINTQPTTTYIIPDPHLAPALPRKGRIFLNQSSNLYLLGMQIQEMFSNAYVYNNQLSRSKVELKILFC